MNEVYLGPGDKTAVIRLKVLPYDVHSTYINIFRVNHDFKNGSLCGRVLAQDRQQAWAGVNIQINDGEAEGPFYFSELGPSPDLSQTDENGRFCFFNVHPGLVELSFFENSQFIGALPVPVFGGTHSEEDLPLETGIARQFVTSVLPSAADQLYETGKVLGQIEVVAGPSLVEVGPNEAFNRVTQTIVATSEGQSLFKGKTLALAEAAEFENTLYSFEAEARSSNAIPVLPLLQRGFVEDLFNELVQQSGAPSIAYDPALGQIVIFHKDDSHNKSVKISLVAPNGQQWLEPWYFGSAAEGLTRAIFFNLEPGNYLVKVEDNDGAILSLRTLAVDYWTVALVQSGNSLYYSTRYRREEDQEESSLGGIE